MIEMKTTHTPGPWRVHEKSPTLVIDKHGLVIAQAHSYAECGIMRDEAEANARLIAAAPELLEALESVVEMYDARPCDAYPKGTLVYLQDVIKPLILKAKGEDNE
jgi:hypothetical protein